MSNDLRRCPFCAETNAIICETDYDADHSKIYAVSCRTRDCHGAIWALGYGLFPTREQAIAAWNTRAAASAPQPVSAWLPIESAMPKFGDRIKNPWASDDNPTKVGIFVRQFRRTGKLNPGTIWEFTDGNGKFWEINKRSFFEKRDE